MSFFIYQGKSIYYEEIGDGTPLLFLHGNAVSSRMFENIIKFYKDQNKVILFDFLGHGQSDRLSKFPADLWYDQALQVIAFLKAKDYKKINIIGCGGGAIAAINVALEAPELVNAVIADSFNGKVASDKIAASITNERVCSKDKLHFKTFYEHMHGDDWEHVLNCDTDAVQEHCKNIRTYFHKPLKEYKPKLLMTGSKKDELSFACGTNFYRNTYIEMIRTIGHGQMHIFWYGNYPSAVSNDKRFAKLSRAFFNKLTVGQPCEKKADTSE